MKALPQTYSAAAAEAKWQSYWQQNQTYAWDESQPRENTYVIDTPPPTVSGLLHMGHIFSYTQADFIARFQRMSGKTVFYPMGFDDNGLPTERLVEKTIKKRATDLGREAFIEECVKVSEEARVEFRNLFESVALSVDWKQEYHTISAESRTISQLSFLDLYAKNECYRKLQPMFWDPIDQTAIAQAEVEDKELPSFFNTILFGIDGTQEELEIATTRPELLAACVALFYHPEDERYRQLKGKFAVTPLFGVKVPIIADELVQIDKGTGLVMCCTFGDETDIRWWKKHNLPTRVILNKYGKVDSAVILPETGLQEHPVIQQLQGKKVSNPDKTNPGAREIMIALLGEEGLLTDQKPITHAVKCAERSGAPLEILPTTQWFVKVIDHRQALKAKGAECTWYPSYMRIRLEQWIDGLAWDWCISRQRYFGVPFPVWYSKRAGEEGKVLLASPAQLPVNPLVDLPDGYSRDEVDAEADVMDTWATSSISPQLNSKGISSNSHSPLEGESKNATPAFLGGGSGSTSAQPPTASLRSATPPARRPPQGGSFMVLNAERHAKLFPADLRPQAHEIIRTWAFYTIVKAYLHENSIPWKNLMISGWCLASDKTKMSKSKGNVITPVELIKSKGADAVRYWSSTSRLGADTAFSEDVLKIGNKLVNKLFNASKFAAIQLEAISGTPTTAKQDVQSGTISETLDKWVLTRLAKAIAKATAAFTEYEYSTARAAIEDFFWNDFCDNYLELVKKRAYGTLEIYGDRLRGENPQQSAIYTIYYVLEAVLRLFAPFTPHVTEELYAHIFEDKHAAYGSIHARGTWPLEADYFVDEAAEAAGVDIRELLDVVRKAKGDAGVSVKWPLESFRISPNEEGNNALLVSCFADLAAVTNARKIIMEPGAKGISTESNGYTVDILLSTEPDAEVP